MSSAVVDIGFSLFGVAVGAWLLFKTNAGRRVVSQVRRRAGPGTNAMAVGLVATTTGVIVHGSLTWLISDSGLQWYEVVGTLVLAVGLGGIFYGVYRAPGAGNGSSAELRG